MNVRPRTSTDLSPTKRRIRKHCMLLRIAEGCGHVNVRSAEIAVLCLPPKKAKVFSNGKATLIPLTLWTS